MKILEVISPQKRITKPQQPSSVLYHGTSLDGLLHIAVENSFRTDLRADAWHRGVSLTRSLKVARSHAASSEEFYKEGFFNEYGDQRVVFPQRGAVMVFDRAKLVAQCGPLIQVDDLGEDREQEERTQLPINPAFISVTTIQVTPRDVAAFEKIIQNFPTDFPPRYQQAWRGLKARIA